MAFYVPRYLDIIDESDLLSVIQEVQFNNPYISQIEKKIGELRAKGPSTKVNTDPLVLEISQLFEEAFGFNSFQLTVVQNMFPNAWTCPVSSSIDMWNYKKMVKQTNAGLQFSPAAKVNTYAVITSSLLFDNKFSDAEIVAVLLHEIGHNFSDSVNKTLGVFSNFKKVLMIPALINPATAINVTNIGKKGKIKYLNYMRKNCPGLVSAFNCLTQFYGILQYMSMNIVNIIRTVNPLVSINSLMLQLQQIVRDPVGVALNVVFNSFGKQDEYTADSFVAMYGYGPELATALSKISRNDMPVADMFKDSDITAMWYAITVESGDFVLSLLSDNHPSDAKRILNLLDTLEQECSKPYINPKFKKETKKEIAELKKIIKDEQQNHSFEGNYWRMAWNRHIYNTQEECPKKKMISDVLDKIESLSFKK